MSSHPLSIVASSGAIQGRGRTGWGYYFGILSFIGGIALGIILESGVSAVIVCGLIYAILAWFFAQRRHWAWITLTIFGFNPVVWIINFIYLRKRWAEDSVATPTI